MWIIETPRLRLRTVTLDDAAFYMALLNSPSFIAQLGNRGIHTLNHARSALADGPLNMQARLGHSLYVVCDRDDRPLGMCGLIKRDELDGVDLGYAFLPEHQGLGYAAEAAAAVLDYGHEVLGIARVLAIVSPQNEKSISILQKIGFHFARIVCLRASDTGTLLYLHDVDAFAYQSEMEGRS
jgi:RimJ/RimL family protein N-acetyltransferase